MNAPLSPEQFAALQKLDTCTVANAIESFGVRLRNEGFCDSSVRCLFPKLPAMLGYAVTLKIRCSSPPPTVRQHRYLDRTEWWDSVLKTAAPRVVVIQDVDELPGRGAFIGEVHANIMRALGCAGAVTNGAVRDLPAIESAGFPLFAGSVGVSHAFAHIVAVGGEVEIGGLNIRPGELLHADQHGVVAVPVAIAPDLPAVAAGLIAREQRIIAVCRERGFSVDKLRAELQGAEGVSQP